MDVFNVERGIAIAVLAAPRSLDALAQHLNDLEDLDLDLYELKNATRRLLEGIEAYQDWQNEEED